MGNSFAIPMSRRSFMKLMGLAAAGTVLGVKGDAAKAEAASPTISTMDFDNAELPVLFDADVCVVGGGVAGTAAAVTAARKGAKVVLVVGRCASGSFAAQASFRIQPTCMSMGEAAGIAVAWGISHGIEANALRWEDIPAEERSYVSEG